MVSISALKNRNVLVFGTGLDSVKCAYKLHNEGIFIKGFLNNDKMLDMFMGCPVYEPDRVHMLRNVYVIVAVAAESVYLTVSKQLVELQLTEFSDYIYYKWIDKKLVLLHGNCHMTVIKDYLESSRTFVSRYAIYPNPLIQNNKNGRIDKNVLTNCAVWIHEDIQKDNVCGYYLSDEYIREQWQDPINNNIEKDRKEIIIPHLFGMGKAFFPQSDWNERNEKIHNAQDINGMFPHADLVIDRCVDKGIAVDDIIAFCKSEAALDEKEIVQNFENYMNKIKDREKSWDVKIYDFIQQNYQKTKLFYDEGHPTNIILEKVSKDILLKLNIMDKVSTNIKLDTHENPVYPAVRNCLHMKWDEHEIRKGRLAKKMSDQMDFEEYIREYLWWNYRI